MPWFVLLENNANEWKRKNWEREKKCNIFLDVERYQVKNQYLIIILTNGPAPPLVYIFELKIDGQVYDIVQEGRKNIASKK